MRELGLELIRQHANVRLDTANGKRRKIQECALRVGLLPTAEPPAADVGQVQRKYSQILHDVPVADKAQDIPGLRLVREGDM